MKEFKDFAVGETRAAQRHRTFSTGSVTSGGRR